MGQTAHRRRKVKNIGGGGARFRILGGGSRGGGNFPAGTITSHRRQYDVMCPLGFQ